MFTAILDGLVRWLSRGAGSALGGIVSKQKFVKILMTLVVRLCHIRLAANISSYLSNRSKTEVEQQAKDLIYAL